MRPVRCLMLSAVLSGLAALLQAVPAVVPAPGGHALAALSSLPVAVSALAYPDLAPWLGALAAAMLSWLYPPGVLAFALTTGPLALWWATAWGSGGRGGTRWPWRLSRWRRGAWS